MARKFQKGQFDFNDLLMQMTSDEEDGRRATASIKMLPGLGDMAALSWKKPGSDDSVIKRQEAIILSMTKDRSAASPIF
jgi:signal recognition particle subunit SRP54